MELFYPHGRPIAARKLPRDQIAPKCGLVKVRESLGLPPNDLTHIKAARF
jgi:hypothetical protein